MTKTNLDLHDLSDLKNLRGRHLLVGRSPSMIALTRIRSSLIKTIREFFDQDGWLEVTPIPAISSLSGACEDFSTLFGLDYFGKKAFLIQTGQQHLEAYIYGPIKKVYTINQSYRAETRASNRRLTAFLLVEAEAANYTLDKIQGVQEKLLYKLCHDIVLQCKDELEILGADLTRLEKISLPLKRILYKDAIELIKEKGLIVKSGEDLKSEHEKALGEIIGQPFFISNYPSKIKFFNMKSDPNDPDLVLSSDLLVPGYGEVSGASEREDDYDKLRRKLRLFSKDAKRIRDMKALGIKEPSELQHLFRWYLDLRKDHQVPHAGFGMGFERIVQWICGLKSITEATEFPKTKRYLSP